MKTKKSLGNTKMPKAKKGKKKSGTPKMANTKMPFAKIKKSLAKTMGHS